MKNPNILHEIEAPVFDKMRIPRSQFIDFLGGYYLSEELEKAGEDSNLNELLSPAFANYHQQNIENAQLEVIEAGKTFLFNSDLPLIQASNLFLAHFARNHLKEHLDPHYLYDSAFAKTHPNGLYVRSGAYILLTEDDKFLIRNFLQEERRWMFNFMDLYEPGFAEKLTKSWDTRRR